jgi:hypothetical protein
VIVTVPENEKESGELHPICVPDAEIGPDKTVVAWLVASKVPVATSLLEKQAAGIVPLMLVVFPVPVNEQTLPSLFVRVKVKVVPPPAATVPVTGPGGIGSVGVFTPQKL